VVASPQPINGPASLPARGLVRQDGLHDYLQDWSALLAAKSRQKVYRFIWQLCADPVKQAHELLWCPSRGQEHRQKPLAL